MSEDVAVFRAWLARNRSHFQRGYDGTPYTQDEVTERAYWVDFDRELVHRELSNFNDAIAGTNIDNRFAFEFDLRMMVRARMAGKRDLRNQWIDLYEYLEYGREFQGAKF